MYYEIILLSTISLITDIWIFETVEFVFWSYDATYITTDIKLYIEQKNDENMKTISLTVIYRVKLLFLDTW